MAGCGKDEVKVLIGIFFLIVFITILYPYVIYPGYYPMDDDSSFHLETIARIKGNENTSDEIYSVGLNTMALSIRELHWNGEYVANYPKIFHHMAALLPFSANLSMGLMIASLFTGVLVLIYIFSRITGLSEMHSFICCAIFLYAGRNNFIWDYIYHYINLTYSQLLFHFLLLLSACVLFAFLKFRKKWMIAVLVLSCIALFLSHNVVYSASLMKFASPRILPLIVSFAVPVIARLSFRAGTWKYFYDLPETRMLLMIFAVLLSIQALLSVNSAVYGSVYFFNNMQLWN